MSAATHSRLVIGGGLVAAGAVAVAIAFEVKTYRYWRPWCLSWGATESEAVRGMPGDDLLADAGIVSTRAVQVNVPPSAIWPWLVQMGPGRGGAYTYDWIENLMGLHMHSTDRILPEHQSLKVGDKQQLGKRGPVLRVAELEPERSLVFRSDDGNWVWAFALVPDCAGLPADQPEPDRHTRCFAARAGAEHICDGAGQLDHGAQDAARYQRPCRAPRPRRGWFPANRWLRWTSPRQCRLTEAGPVTERTEAQRR